MTVGTIVSQMLYLLNLPMMSLAVCAPVVHIALREHPTQFRALLVHLIHLKAVSLSLTVLTALLDISVML